MPVPTPSLPSLPTPRLVGAMIVFWVVFISWVGGPSRTAEPIERWRWLLAGRPMLHVRLGEHAPNPKIRKYEVSVRFPDNEPVLMEFGTSDPLIGALSMAVPAGLLEGARQVEVQIAGLDDKGCILEGGEQHIGRSAQSPFAAAEPVIQVNMKTLPRALCVL